MSPQHGSSGCPTRRRRLEYLVGESGLLHARRLRKKKTSFEVACSIASSRAPVVLQFTCERTSSDTRTAKTIKKNDVLHPVNRETKPTMASRSSEHPLYRAVEAGHLKRLRKLLRSGVDPNGGLAYPSPLCLATYVGRLNVVESLLTHRADPNHGGAMERFPDATPLSPLMLAVLGGRLDIVNALLRNGADPNVCRSGPVPVPSLAIAKPLSPLTLAVERGRLDIVNALLRNGADPNACRWPVPVLSLAIALGRIDMVSALRPHCCGSTVGSGVFTAVKHGRVDILPILLGGYARGVEHRSPGSRQTPLMLAAKTSQPEAVCFLLRHGANANAADSNGDTPLIHAMSRAIDSAHVIDIVDMLLYHGADATKTNLAGESPLAFAVEIDNAPVCRLLRMRGADPRRPDKFSCSPIDIARRRNDSFLRTILENPVYVQGEPVCTVCLDTIFDDKTVIQTCGHRFHGTCLDLWIQAGHGTCPTCCVRIPHSRPVM